MCLHYINYLYKAAPPAPELKNLASFESQHNNIKTEKEVNMYKSRPLYPLIKYLLAIFYFTRWVSGSNYWKIHVYHPINNAKTKFSKKTEDAAVLFVKKSWVLGLC